MTDDPKALIAEARERAARLLGDEPCSPIITESIISRLADALERATEGLEIARKAGYDEALEECRLEARYGD